MAQLFFGAGAIKRKKKKDPPAVNLPVGDTPSDSYVLVINGRKYEPNAWVLGSIVYYNCVVIYVIIAVSLGFFYRQVPWSPEACQSNADCYYFNYSTVVTQDGEPTATRIINCTLDEAYDVNNVLCYDVGFHSVVGIAMLGSFLNIVTPLLFAIVTRFHVFWGQKFVDLKKEENSPDGNAKCSRKMLILCCGLSATALLQLAISFTLFILLISSLFYTPIVDQSSFQFFFQMKRTLVKE